jgi:hypothetical protein
MSAVETRVLEVPGTGAFIRIYVFPGGNRAVDTQDWDALTERDRAAVEATGLKVVGETETWKVTEAKEWPAASWEGEKA